MATTSTRYNFSCDVAKSRLGIPSAKYKCVGRFKDLICAFPFPLQAFQEISTCLEHALTVNASESSSEICMYGMRRWCEPHCSHVNIEGFVAYQPHTLQIFPFHPFAKLPQCNVEHGTSPWIACFNMSINSVILAKEPSVCGRINY